jgi:hypothetical protein
MLPNERWTIFVASLKLSSESVVGYYTRLTMPMVQGIGILPRPEWVFGVGENPVLPSKRGGVLRGILTLEDLVRRDLEIGPCCVQPPPHLTIVDIVRTGSTEGHRLA